MAEIYELVNRDDVLEALAATAVHPAFDEVVADHVTYKGPAGSTPPPVDRAMAVGYVVGHGVDALVVELGGRIERPDGNAYHLTLSLAEGHQAREAEELTASAVADDAFTELAGITLELRPPG